MPGVARHSMPELRFLAVELPLYAFEMEAR
jgi:hypothetical protein